MLSGHTTNPTGQVFYKGTQSLTCFTQDKSGHLTNLLEGHGRSIISLHSSRLETQVESGHLIGLRGLLHWTIYREGQSY